MISVLVLYNNPTIAAMLARSLTRYELEVRTTAEGRKADVALVEWEGQRAEACRELLDLAGRAARQVILLHKSGTTPKGKFAAVLHLPLLPDEIAAVVKQVCQEKEQCNVASF